MELQRQPDEALATPEREREHCPLELSSLGLKWWGLYILIRLSHWTQPAWERADLQELSADHIPVAEGSVSPHAQTWRFTGSRQLVVMALKPGQ